MPTCSRALVLVTDCIGSCLLLAGCFSPTGQAGATAGTSTTTTVGPTSTSATDPTTEGSTAATVEPTGGPTVTSTPQTNTATDAPTGGDCGACPDAAPYCGPGGECIDCVALEQNGVTCEDLDPSRPICDESLGLCVGCTESVGCDTGVCHPEKHTCVGCVDASDCPGGLACPPETNTCVACREHSDCPDSACELDVGTCFPPDARHWYVSAGRTCADGNGTLEQPSCEIADAVGLLADTADAYHVIHVDASKYVKTFTLGVPKRVAILAEENATLEVGVDGKPVVLVGSVDVQSPIDTKLFVSRLKFTGYGSVALSCYQAALTWLDDVTVYDFAVGDSLFTSKCQLRVRRGRFLGNNGGLKAGAEGTLAVENSILSGAKVATHLTALAGGTLDLNYTTVGLQMPVPNGLLYCPDASASVSIRNSALVSDEAGSFVSCAGQFTFSTSITSENSYQGAPGISVIAPTNVPAQFVGWGADDLHAVDGGALADVALWQAMDPPADIDGQPRPTTPGTPDYAGADLPGAP